MNDSIVCKSSPVKILTISAATLRELLNFLIYGQHPELLIERTRRQLFLPLEKFPLTVRELKDLLKGEKYDKNGKLASSPVTNNFKRNSVHKNTIPPKQKRAETGQPPFGSLLFTDYQDWKYRKLL